MQEAPSNLPRTFPAVERRGFLQSVLMPRKLPVREGAIQTTPALSMSRTIDPRAQRTTDTAADAKFQSN